MTETSKKLNALWKHAMDRGDLEMVGVRVDPESWMAMLSEAHCGGDGSIDIHGRERTWRGLKPTFETYLPPPPDLVSGVEVSQTDTIQRLPIASIECRDRRSGRPVFLNDPTNPPGYE